MTNQKTTIPEKIFYGERYQDTLEEAGLGERFFYKLDLVPEKLIQVDAVTGQTETASSVKYRACQVATELLDIGTNPNDIVALCCLNRLDEAAVVLGTLFSGAQLAILDPDMRNAELKAIVNKLQPKVIFCDPRVVNQLETNDLRHHVYVFGKTQKKKPIGTIFTKTIPEDFAPVAIANPEKKTAFIFLTDATTGAPKIVRVSHVAAFARITKLLNCLLKDVKKVLSYFPLLGTEHIMLTCCCFENPIVRVVHNEFSEREASRVIHDLKVDAVILSAQNTKALGDYNLSGQDYNIGCLKRILIGGTITTASNMMYLQKIFPNLQILNLYSVVECGLIAGLTVDDLEKLRINPATIGNVYPGGKIKIVDFTTHMCLGPGKWGEIYYSGPDLALSYFDDSPNDFLDNGYFRTGDIAQFDDHGCLYILGRLDDMFEAEGHTFFAIDLESILMTHSKVKDCVVVKNAGQMMVYVIVSDILTKDLYKWLETKVPAYMMPTMIYIVNDIPRTNNGKVKKYMMSNIISRKSILESITD